MKGKTATYSRESLAAACTLGITLLGLAVARSQPPQPAQPGQATACAGDQGGITLSPGFCATVFADKLGHVRQMVVAPNGILYANSWSGRYYNDDRPPPGGMLIALQDTKSNGTADKVVRFGRAFAEGDHGGTGIALYNGYLYAETNDRIVRYRVASSGIAPIGNEETVVFGLPLTGDHPMHPIRIDANGNMYMDSGLPPIRARAKTACLTSRG
jgi:glucose/arabinose dehydrogenase